MPPNLRKGWRKRVCRQRRDRVDLSERIGRTPNGEFRRVRLTTGRRTNPRRGFLSTRRRTADAAIESTRAGAAPHRQHRRPSARGQRHVHVRLSVQLHVARSRVDSKSRHLASSREFSPAGEGHTEALTRWRSRGRRAPSRRSPQSSAIGRRRLTLTLPYALRGRRTAGVARRVVEHLLPSGLGRRCLRLPHTDLRWGSTVLSCTARASRKGTKSWLSIRRPYR